jgi:serine/threonine protein kinase
MIQLADFALVRTLSTPPKKLTSEVITLWYRPPEILMGQRNYTAAVDIWSIGCIFAELIQGRAIFEG